MSHRTLVPALLTSAALLVTLSACAPDATPTASTSTPTRTATADPALPPGLTPTEIKALPATDYDAVIPGLLAAPATAKVRTTYTIPFDLPVYGADFRTPVARIPAKNFLNDPTVIVPVERRGKWALILTPSRQKLPSTATADSPAPAQSAAWVPAETFQPASTIKHRVVISTTKQTLRILDAKGKQLSTFPVGVGTADTPTPTGTTGYLQARYHDPAQGQTEHRIQLTSLHATAADEPFSGGDGGLIGIHYQSTARGAVSHGCIRLSAEAIAAVDALPLGTPVEIID